MIQTPRRDQHPSGIFDTTIVADNARCGPFFIADAILTARDKWTALGGWNPGQTQVVSAHAYNGTTGGSFYVPSTQTIYIESGEDLIQGFPDTFDRDIIVHEYAHRLQDNSDFFDRNPGDDHHWYIESSDSMAASEGWATFLSCCLKDTPNSVLRSLSNSFRDTLWYNSENGTWGKNYSTNGSANAMGETCEAAVAGALWDIFDSSPTLEDYSGWGDRGHVTLPHHPDGVGDSLSVSATQINNVLLTRYVNGRHPQTFPEFFQAWCSNPTMDHRQALSDICYEHGFACCIGVYGNVDGDPDEVVDSSDLFGIIDVMTLGRPIPCMGEADMVQDGVIDISDMFAMIDFLNGVVSLSPCT